MNLSSPAAVGTLLRRHNLKPQHRLGQNFLVDQNTLKKIADAGQIHIGDSVLEIGAGLGVLTRELAERVGEQGRVVTVEIDHNLLPVLNETVGDLSQVTVMSQDALSLDLTPIFLLSPDLPFKVIANIPYQITSPLIALFLGNKAHVATIVLLVQQEVAQRLIASHGTPSYGAFSVFAQYHAKVELIGTVSKNCFFPPPEVTSAIIRLTPHLHPESEVADEALFFAIVKAAFGQRRKTIANALSNDPELNWSKEHTLAALASAAIAAERRGETLSISEFAKLANL